MVRQKMDLAWQKIAEDDKLATIVGNGKQNKERTGTIWEFQLKLYWNMNFLKTFIL